MNVIWVSNPGLADFTESINLLNTIFAEDPGFKAYIPEISQEKTKNAKDVAIVKVLEDKQFVGFAMCYDRYPNYYHLWELGVLKEHRNKGVASAMYDVIEKHALKNGYKGVTMASFNIHKDSIRLALKRGYEIYDFDKTGEFKNNPRISLRLTF